MVGALYEALKDAGAGESAAREAAEEVARHQARLNDVEGKLKLLQWMVGANTILSVAILLKVLSAG